LLTALVASGLGGPASFWALEHWAYFCTLSAEHKRYVAMALSVIVGVLAFGAMILMGWTATPATSREWIETVANVMLNILSPAALTYGVSQVVHARADLSRVANPDATRT
jgi:hypothetical protein